MAAAAASSSSSSNAAAAVVATKKEATDESSQKKPRCTSEGITTDTLYGADGEVPKGSGEIYAKTLHLIFNDQLRNLVKHYLSNDVLLKVRASCKDALDQGKDYSVKDIQDSFNETNMPCTPKGGFPLFDKNTRKWAQQTMPFNFVRATMAECNFFPKGIPGTGLMKTTGRAKPGLSGR